MASENAFNKRLSAESTMDKIEGLLEHFNLPPKVLAFIRDNQKLIKIILIVAVVLVVAVSLYSSYRGRIKEEASSALATALRQSDAGQAEMLQKIVDKYGSTTSALWAKVELAQLDMKNGAYADASEKYRKILNEVKESNPVYPLVLFGLAQSFEAEKKYGEATDKYNILKDIKGFEHLGYSGMERIEEMQGNLDKAIAIYNNFLVSIGGDPSLAQAKEEVENKIARLKARQ